jgi:hypothetical protein
MIWDVFGIFARALTILDLKKSYDKTQALDGINLQVPQRCQQNNDHPDLDRSFPPDFGPSHAQWA